MIEAKGIRLSLWHGNLESRCRKGRGLPEQVILVLTKLSHCFGNVYKNSKLFPHIFLKCSKQSSDILNTSVCVVLCFPYFNAKPPFYVNFIFCNSVLIQKILEHGSDVTLIFFHSVFLSLLLQVKNVILYNKPWKSKVPGIA